VAIAAAGGGATATGLAAVALISPRQWGLLLLSVLLSGYLGSRCHFEAQRTMRASSAQSFLAPQPLFAALWARLFLGEGIDPSLVAAGALMASAVGIASTDPAAGVASTDTAADVSSTDAPATRPVAAAVAPLAMRAAAAPECPRESLGAHRPRLAMPAAAAAVASPVA